MKRGLGRMLTWITISMEANLIRLKEVTTNQSIITALTTMLST
jgi:hypothetical protein